ncbi:MAG: flagellar biosynthetic protein FliO [Zetaproteobacteria bacterium]|nr:flagellar biosynthetic protein FliO [Zetaproteobacteria bacterium]
MIVYLRSISFLLLLMPFTVFAADDVLPTMPDNYGLLAKIIVALGVVLTLFMLLIWMLKRMQGLNGGGQSGAMQIEQRLHIDGRHAVVVLKRGSRRWLLGLSNEQISALGEWHEDSADYEPSNYQRAHDQAVKDQGR